MDALHLLDYNCWRFVFRKLNGEDLLSCRQVCKPFNRLLDEEDLQRKWKFHLIFPLLFDHLKSSSPENNSDWLELLNIRLACRSWRYSVDNYLSKIYKRRMPLSPDSFRLFPLATRLFSSEEIDEFHNRFGNHEGNPFPSKTVCFDRLGLQPANVTKITNFVEQFGSHILKLGLDFTISHQECYADYLRLFQLLKDISNHLRNLTILSICCVNEDNQDPQQSQDDPQQLATWIGENPPISDLPKLQASSLTFNQSHDIVENYLAKKYAQIGSYCEVMSSDGASLRLSPQVLQSIRQLTLNLLDDTDVLEYLREMVCPLKILKLFLRGEGMTWNVDRALRNVKHLPLECLQIIGFDDVCVSEEGLELEEYINESIHTLSIKFYTDEDEDEEFVNYEISFNFLQALRKLETLKLTMEGVTTHPEEIPEVVELNEHLFFNSLYHSNVWEKVPSLKTLIDKRLPIPFNENQFDESIYTREEYERNKE